MSLSELAKFTIVSKYAKHLPERNRRETWEETVERCRDMHLRKYDFLSDEHKEEIKRVFQRVYNKQCAPSMRSLQFGGEAIERKNARMYNCCVTHVYNSRAIEKAFWLLLCGCGVGLGLGRKWTSKFPTLKPSVNSAVEVYVVPDTIEGWAQSTKLLIDSYTDGTSPKIIFDYSQIREKGAPLSIGGKAPGAEGLRNCHKKIEKLLYKRLFIDKRERLSSRDLYDILMHCSDAVLSGGIRRSATIVMFDVDDEEMLTAKSNIPVEDFIGMWKDNSFVGKVLYEGEWVRVNLSQYEGTVLEQNKVVNWYHLEPQRGRSNNSAVIKGDINEDVFKEIFNHTKNYGEPGFVFVKDEDTLFNPCAEIGFIPVENGEPAVQFCNLSLVNGNKVKSKEDLLKYVEAATIIGTLQAGYTDFEFLDEVDKKMTEDEALLGVSILGFLSNPDILLNEEILREASAFAVEVNERWANLLGIKPAARVTCVKPDGNSSAALESPFSGIHPAHSPKYYRRVQVNKEENPYRHFWLYNSHVCEESIYSENKTDDVISFPIEVEGNAIFKSDLTAIDHLKIIRMVQDAWVLGGQKNNRKNVTNNVSCTVLVKDHEWDEVADYLYENKEFFAAVSFLSDKGDKIYKQAPYESISEEEVESFHKLQKSIMGVDYSLMMEYDDNTVRNEEVACSGGACVI